VVVTFLDDVSSMNKNKKSHTILLLEEEEEEEEEEKEELHLWEEKLKALVLELVVTYRDVNKNKNKSHIQLIHLWEAK
jgi:hypothetical protein